MPPSNDAEKELAAAERELSGARKRVAALRQRRRSLLAEGGEIADAIQQALFESGRAGVEPTGIDTMRERVAATQVALEDLQRVEDGAALHLQECINAVEAAVFAAAPALEKDLEAQAAKLEQERRDLEQRLGQLGEREEDVRAGFRRIAATIPGCGELVFDGVRPSQLPTQPRANQAHFLDDGTWPSWYQQLVTAANRAAKPEGAAA
jgi:chromosome segregation ATPase